MIIVSQHNSVHSHQSRYMPSFRINLKNVIPCFLCVFLVGTIALSGYIMALERCHCPPAIQPDEAHVKEDNNKFHGHKLALLVPFRDRFEELLAFAPHMEKFLNKQNVHHTFYILNQVDELRFNRASLINVGFKLIRRSFDYFVIHDVDLLPLNDDLPYTHPGAGVFHISSPSLHPKYNYPTFLGGILLVKREDFEKVNGMSNRYWGWGLEDDEFYTRLKDAEIEVKRPEGISTNSSNTFRHMHEKERRKRDMQKCYNQRLVTRKRDRVTGLHDVKYSIDSTIPLTIDGIHVSVINIRLECDHVLTPWCQCEKLQSGKPAKPG